MSDNKQPRELAEELIDQIPDKADVTIDSLTERFEGLAKFDIYGENAKKSVISNIRSEYDLDFEDFNFKSGSPDEIEIGEINTDGDFVTVKGEVSELWDPTSDNIAQTGLVYDDTGTIKFTSWKKSELPILNEGQTYKFENVVTNEWNGKHSINLTSETTVKMIDDEFEQPQNSVEFTGPIVKVYENSGLIKRCSVEGCNRVLKNGECPEHGEVEGEFDLRIKAVVDDGKETRGIIIGREKTEDITGILLEEAKNMAQEAFDTEVVKREMEEEILLNYYTFEGFETDWGDVIVESISDVEPIESDDVENLLIRASSLVVEDENDQPDMSAEKQEVEQ